MLWDVFGNQLERVPTDDVFKLSSAEIEAFTCLKHHQVETALAVTTRRGAPPAMVNQQVGQAETQLKAKVDSAAIACESVKDLAAVEAIRQDINTY